MVVTKERLTIDSLKGKYGGPVFLLGSGPSLASQVEYLPVLKDKHTFSCNRLQQWDQLRFSPTYHACNINTVRKGIEPDMPRFKRHKFIVGRERDFGYHDTSGWVEVTKSLAEPAGIDHINPVATGASMSYIIAQIAVWLGHRKIYLLGCDTKEGPRVFESEPNTHLVSPNYKERWQELKKFFTANGITIRDCTPDGALNDIVGYTPLAKVLNV